MNFLELFKQENLIAAHRGARSIAPENTLRSMQESVGHCDFIEIDVGFSSDNVAVILHDDTLKRTTNVSSLELFKMKKPYKVSDFSFKELNSLDYGSWFDSKYEPLLTLEKALKFIKEKNLFLNIEIKDVHKTLSDKKVVSMVLDEVRVWHVENLVSISSFRHEYLSLSKEIIPNIPTAALVDDKHPDNTVEYLKNLGVEFYNMNDELVSKEMVGSLKKAGFFVNVYTINNISRAKELFNMGVSAIFTDSLQKDDIL